MYCIESYAMSYLFQESSLSHLRSKYHKCDSYCSALHEHSNVMSFFLDSSHLIGHKNYGHMLENCDTYLFVAIDSRSEEHTSELQSRFELVYRLLVVIKNV